MIFNHLKQLGKTLTTPSRLMGLDVGTKTIGVAVCDPDRIISTPQLTVKRQGNQKDFPILEKLIKERDIKAVIIGLPLNMDGTESEMSRFIRRFADNLNKFLPNIKITFQDERLTSFIAKDTIAEIKVKDNKGKKLVDQIAAGIILQSALDELSH